DRGGRWPWRRGTAQSARDIVRPAEGTMRQGFRVIDSDTHVNPSLDVLLRYADNELKQRIDDLQPYRRTVKTVPGRGDAEDVGSSTILSVRPVRLQRVAGEKSAPATQGDGDRGFLSGRTQDGHAAAHHRARRRRQWPRAPARHGPRGPGHR